MRREGRRRLVHDEDGHLAQVDVNLKLSARAHGEREEGGPHLRRGLQGEGSVRRRCPAALGGLRGSGPLWRWAQQRPEQGGSLWRPLYKAISKKTSYGVTGS